MPLKNYGLVSSLDELADHVTRLVAAGTPIGFDIETGYRGPDREKWALHPETAHVVGISFTNSTDWARYVPLGHDCGGNLDNRHAARLLWQLLCTGLGVAHNAGFELRHLAKFFREFLGDDPDLGPAVTAAHGYFPVRSDTMVEAYLLADYPQFGLKPLTDRLFGHKMTELHELFPSLAKNKRKHLRFNILPLDPKVVEYACEDSVWCLAIHQHYHPRVSTRGLYTVEMAIATQVVPAMEDVGVRYDWARMRNAATALRVFRDRFNAEVMRDLTAMVGRPVGINLASPPAISKLLYDTLGFTTTVYTATTRNLPKDQRKMSTGKIALQRLAKQYPVVEKIRQWKEMTRLLGTYLDKYEDAYGYANDGHTHPNHLSAVIPTGRFAVGDPPYQQSPKTYHFDLNEAAVLHARHAEDHGKDCACEDPQYVPPVDTCFRHNFRDNIVAPAGWYILGFDLSQAELRAIAGEAEETALLKAFADNVDVHTLTASMLFGISLDEVTKKQRAIGKAQPIDALIMTPHGPRRMGDLHVGDQVIGSEGKPVSVTGVFPQGRREVFRVTTTDGATVETCGEHLWTIRNVNTKSKKWTTRPLQELIASGLYRKPQFVKGKEYSQPKYELPERVPVHFNSKGELPFDPYVMGLLLGDGGFTHSWAPMFGSKDSDLLLAVRHEHERLGGRWASEREQTPGFTVAYLAAGERFKRGTNVIKDALRGMGLWGKRDHEKFVPEVFLYAEPVDRLALLQGLLDTDGNVLATGAQFRVVSESLARDVQWLARSLGGFASIKCAPGPVTPFHTVSAPQDRWSVYLRLPSNQCPFRLNRKRAAWGSPRYQANQHILSVDSVGEKDVQCISVDAPDGLYLSSSFVYSHNTMNFALLYGMGVKSLADRLGIPLDEGQRLYDTYFTVYAGIAAWTQKQVTQGKTFGFVTDRFGRHMPIWEFQSDNEKIRQKGERQCVNYPIQGGATGSYVKGAMVRAMIALRKAALTDKVKLVMNIHDALEFYVHGSIDPTELIAVLQPAVIYPVPGWPAMKADWHAGRRWGSPQELTVMPDGRLLVADGRIVDVPATLEHDEDEDEEVLVLPDEDYVSPEEVSAVLATLADPARRTVTVALQAMPAHDAWQRFTQLMTDLPGAHRVRLETPEGELELDVTTGLGPQHVADASVILGPVTIRFAPSQVDTEGLLQGLTL